MDCVCRPELKSSPASALNRGGRRIELTTREYRLLEYLMKSPGRICTRMMIFEKVWDYHFDPGSNLIDVYVRRLRDKLGRAGRLVETVRGSGYRLNTAEG